MAGLGVHGKKVMQQFIDFTAETKRPLLFLHMDCSDEENATRLQSDHGRGAKTGKQRDPNVLAKVRAEYRVGVHDDVTASHVQQSYHDTTGLSVEKTRTELYTPVFEFLKTAFPSESGGSVQGTESQTPGTQDPGSQGGGSEQGSQDLLQVVTEGSVLTVTADRETLSK